MNGIDAKHRLSVPAPIRETVEARSNSRMIVLAPAEHAPCLIGYDVGHFQAVEEGLARRFEGDFGPGRSTLARNLFGMADTLKVDDTGRMILTPILRELAELQSTALFLGAGACFELWAPELLLAQEGQDPRLIRTVKALVAQRGAP